MMLPIRDDHPIRDVFAGLVENTFWVEVGLCEPKLTDYLADLMVEFIHVDHFQILNHAFGKTLEQMAAMLAVCWGTEPMSTEQRDRWMYRHIGDFALFWSGIFPEQIRSSPSKRDLLGTYVAKGKRSYAAAAKLTDENDEPPASLLSSLSEEFESCVHGLGLVRKCWQHTDTDLSMGPGELWY